MALTFDDGPFQFSTIVANAITAAGGHTTFFINGKNYGCIYDFAGGWWVGVANGLGASR